MALQKIQVIGNLTRDCVVNNVNGKQVINMSIAANEKYKNHQGIEVNGVTYYDISYWTESAALAQYLRKGQQLFVEGKPSIKMFTTSDGKQAANIAIRVQQIQLLGGNPKDNQQPQQQKQHNPEVLSNDNLDF